MMEKHPFADFTPNNSQYLILGSFVGKVNDESYNWFYSNQRSQFWPILGAVYKLNLDNKKEKQRLFTRLGIAITDIISSCQRKENNNSDTNLINIIMNDKIVDILEKNRIKKIYFTSKFVEKLFKKHFKCLIQKNTDVELITLPSPSPRYARITRSEKIAIYKQLLPIRQVSK